MPVSIIAYICFMLLPKYFLFFKSVQGRVGFWTSGTRRKTNDTFFWGNGKSVGFTDWENGRPDNLNQSGEQEECIEIKGFNILKWNDNLCNYGLYYICEEAVKTD